MLSPTQRRVIAALCSGDPQSSTRLAEYVYGYRSDGGPADPSAEIRKQVLKIRTKLAEHGAEIETVGTNGRGIVGYRVRPDHVPRVRALIDG